MTDSPKRYFCVHGHFYQPPRENPWLETVENEKSAAPYHNWNDRITDECYAVNLAARILDGSGRIVSIVNNYSRLSFNFGPTLLAWMETNQLESYTAITDSDRENAAAYGGHGPAMAQAYNHIIMPLANTRDKETQVIWGISDFRHRFNQVPEGMWLPETAVDLETLDIMAAHGIKFTILAPHQAGRIRTPGGQWHGGGSAIDTLQPYICRLPSGRTIAVFFYHTDLSRGIAFGGLLNNGDVLADRVLAAYGQANNPSLVTIASDGETYGHHHHFGEMALAYAFEKLQKSGVRITNPAEYLELQPPAMEVEIVENSAWSCDHGVERWRSGCCCTTGLHPGWNQEWRAPLRQAMDLLRDRLAPAFEREAKLLFKDPWAARNAYESVIADRSAENIKSFFGQTAVKSLSRSERVRGLKLMELQRYLMAIYTSCGWFFDDIGGLESAIVLRCAGRAMQLAQEVFGERPEKEILDILATAKSNDPAIGSGRDIYERNVRPLIVDLRQAAANFAMDSLFREPGAESRLYSFLIDVNDRRQFGSGRLRLAAGDIVMNSILTLESEHLVYAALIWGDHNLLAGVSSWVSEDDYQRLLVELKALSDRSDCAGCLKFLKSRFAGAVYDMHQLFSDERSWVIEQIVAGTLSEAEAAHREVFKRHHETMRFLSSLGQSAPPQFTASAAFVINTDLERALEAEKPDLDAMKDLVAEIRLWGIAPDKERLSYFLAGQLESLLIGLSDNPDDTAAMADATGLLRIIPGDCVSAQPVAGRKSVFFPFRERFRHAAGTA